MKTTNKNAKMATSMSALDVEDETILTAVFKDSFPGLS